MVATEETEKGGLPARRILGERGTMAQESMHDWPGGFMPKLRRKKMIGHRVISSVIGRE